jgi:hypothetical protein
MSALFYPRGVSQTGIPFPPLKAVADGSAVNTGATAYVSKDGGTFVAVDTAAYVQGTDGSWFIDPSATEMDAKTITYKLTAADALSVQVAIVTDASLGAGSYTVTLQFGSLASQAKIWITTQNDPSTVIVNGLAELLTGDFLTYLDAGSYYAYGSLAGVNFANPMSFIVTANQTIDLSSNVTSATSGLTESAYADIAAANAYLANTLGTDGWDSASTLNQNKALVMATRAINRLRYQGFQTEDARTAGNQFPRGTDTAVPDAVVGATIEEANALLGDILPDEAFKDLRVKRESMSGVSITYDTSLNDGAHTRAGFTSRTAYNMLKPYLYDRKSMRVDRV